MTKMSTALMAFGLTAGLAACAAVDPKRCEVTVSPTQGVLADDSDAATVTVVVRDSRNDGVEGVAVRLSTYLQGSRLTPCDALSDRDGVVTARWTSVIDGRGTLTVEVDVNGRLERLAAAPAVRFEASRAVKVVGDSSPELLRAIREALLAASIPVQSGSEPTQVVLSVDAGRFKISQFGGFFKCDGELDTRIERYGRELAEERITAASERHSARQPAKAECRERLSRALVKALQSVVGRAVFKGVQ